MTNQKKFINKKYEEIIRDLINDAFYVKGTSSRGKISKIRQYSEIIVRKLLDLSEEEYVTLGDKGIKSKLKKKYNNDPFLLDAINIICNNGNKCTHTQYTGKVTTDDEKYVEEKLIKLYSYLFIDYFRRYEFGSNKQIMRAFSILPPIIRYTVLNELNSRYNKNINIIDKLCISIVKSFGKEVAINWLNDNKSILMNISAIKPELEKEIDKIFLPDTHNMYEVCESKIEGIAKQIYENGSMYNTFEEAIVYYKRDGIVEGKNSEIKEFNSIMEFLYLGRKEKEKLIN